ESDPEIGEERETRCVVLMRLVIELIDPEQDGAADDEREAYDPGIEQHFLDVLAEDQADDNRGQEPDQQADDEAAIIPIGEHASRDLPQLGEIDHDDCEDRAELNQDRKALPEIVFAKIEEALGKQQMAG